MESTKIGQIFGCDVFINTEIRDGSVEARLGPQLVVGLCVPELGADRHELGVPENDHHLAKDIFEEPRGR